MRSTLPRLCLGALTCLLLGAFAAQADDAVTTHALSLFGEPKYDAAFTHFEYANPAAPKGGTVRLSADRTFDTLNPFTLKGIAGAGAALIYDSLTYGTEDEPFSQYGLLAETITVGPDNGWVEYTIRRDARWHDGVPITPADVVWTFNTLMTQGHPFYAKYYNDVTDVQETGPRKVRFAFSPGVNRELALIVGEFDVLPKHYWEGREFAATTLEPPLGSGPYRFGVVDPGRSIVYERVPDYWGRDLAVNMGRHNFDRIRYDYYRDANVMIEALKAGEYDFRAENIAKEWATAYDIEAVDEGLLVRRTVDHELPTGMQGYVFNVRRKVFQNRTLRQALAFAFDFEWTNRTLFYGQYDRTESYFSNSELASRGEPSPDELALLEPHRADLPTALFEGAYQAPGTDGSGNNRANLRIAQRMLNEAGYRVDGQSLVDPDGEPVAFEILLGTPAFERITSPFVNSLERLGVRATIRIVDRAQYENRLREFDYDMMVMARGQSFSPGNEQRDFWTSAAANTPGSGNYPGIADPIVDELVDAVIRAPDRTAQVSATRALDRVLLHGHYVIPHWHISKFRLIYWNRFGIPPVAPRYGLGFPSTWWYDADLASQDGMPAE
ncbi:MAG: ABC transporter substrate-binding protein [Alphaproteobacteria bacterium]|nr:ABC transporter substrate-binding protein [Alphaproteobacteria bacterium]